MAVCKECKQYAAEALELCGNCLLKQGKEAGAYDPVIQERRRVRAQEDESGKFPKADLEMLKLAAMDRAPSPKIEGMRPAAGVMRHEGKEE